MHFIFSQMDGVTYCHRPKINRKFMVTEEEKLMKKMREIKQKMRKLARNGKCRIRRRYRKTEDGKTRWSAPWNVRKR